MTSSLFMYMKFPNTFFYFSFFHVNKRINDHQIFKENFQHKNDVQIEKKKLRALERQKKRREAKHPN